MTKTHNRHRVDNRHNKRNTGDIVTVALVAGAMAVGLTKIIDNGNKASGYKPQEGAERVEFVIGETRDSNGNVITTPWQIAETAIGDNEDVDPRVVVDIIRDELPKKDQKNVILHDGQVITLGPKAQGGTRVESASASVNRG